MVIIFDSNPSNLWTLIFENPLKISKYHFLFKSNSNLEFLRSLRILGHSLIKCMGKTHNKFTVEVCKNFNGFASKNSVHNVYVNTSI